jgi:light-regulated signal transduction histidine kinase (bacteriophytochrome)
MAKRQQYTKEFKREAVRLWKSSGCPAAAVARELGLRRNHLHQRSPSVRISVHEIGASSGLGLSIVHQIIQEHGGTVEARSTVGKGTIFLITLPEGRTQEPTSASSAEWQDRLMTARRTPTLP